MVGGHRRAFEDNKKLRAQSKDMEKIVLERENIQRENEDLRRKLDAAGGEEFVMLASRLQSKH